MQNQQLLNWKLTTKVSAKVISKKNCKIDCWVCYDPRLEKAQVKRLMKKPLCLYKNISLYLGIKFSMISALLNRSVVVDCIIISCSEVFFWVCKNFLSNWKCCKVMPTSREIVMSSMSTNTTIPHFLTVKYCLWLLKILEDRCCWMVDMVVELVLEMLDWGLSNLLCWWLLLKDVRVRVEVTFNSSG